MDVSLRLATRAVAKRVSRGRRDCREDPPWAEEYPMEGDRRACLAYLRQLPVLGGPTRSSPWGYYQILVADQVVGGIGFHGPPRDGLVEVGYGVVPSARRRGVATESLRQMLEVAVDQGGVCRVCGRTSPDNVGSQKVMLGVGFTPSGRDPDFLHFEIDVSERTR